MGRNADDVLFCDTCFTVDGPMFRCGFCDDPKLQGLMCVKDSENHFREHHPSFWMENIVPLMKGSSDGL